MTITAAYRVLDIFDAKWRVLSENSERFAVSPTRQALVLYMRHALVDALTTEVLAQERKEIDAFTRSNLALPKPHAIYSGVAIY